MKDRERIRAINETANAVTHGIGALLAVPGLVLLVVFACLYGDTRHVVSFSIYGATLFFLFLASTCYHSVKDPQLKQIFRIIDHSAIYLLIAGTYTPFTLITLKGVHGWVMFGVIWGMATVGVLYKLFFFKRYTVISALFYLAMGWMIVFSLGPLLQNLPRNGMVLLIAGGLSYTLGIVFYAGRDRLLMHAIWHLFVLAGSILHFFSILLYVLPPRM